MPVRAFISVREPRRALGLRSNNDNVVWNPHMDLVITI